MATCCWDVCLQPPSLCEFSDVVGGGAWRGRRVTTATIWLTQVEATGQNTKFKVWVAYCTSTWSTYRYHARNARAETGLMGQADCYYITTKGPRLRGCTIEVHPEVTRDVRITELVEPTGPRGQQSAWYAVGAFT